MQFRLAPEGSKVSCKNGLYLSFYGITDGWPVAFIVGTLPLPFSGLAYDASFFVDLVTEVAFIATDIASGPLFSSVS